MQKLKEELIDLLLTIRSCKKQNIPNEIILEYTYKKLNEIITKNYQK